MVLFGRKIPQFLGWQIRKLQQFFSHEVSNSMAVFSRIHLRVSSLWTFLFRRHTVLYSSRRFFANNYIYKRAKASFLLELKLQVSLDVCAIFSCFLVPFEGSFQSLKLGLWHTFKFHPFLFLYLIIRIIMITCFQISNIVGGTSIN